MENMNLFDMLGDFGIKTPVVEKKENKVEKKVEKTNSRERSGI